MSREIKISVSNNIYFQDFYKRSSQLIGIKFSTVCLHSTILTFGHKNLVRLNNIYWLLNKVKVTILDRH